MQIIFIAGILLPYHTVQAGFHQRKAVLCIVRIAMIESIVPGSVFTKHRIPVPRFIGNHIHLAADEITAPPTSPKGRGC
jgi:hypothetical protein